MFLVVQKYTDTQTENLITAILRSTYTGEDALIVIFS